MKIQIISRNTIKNNEQFQIKIIRTNFIEPFHVFFRISLMVISLHLM